jgi:hypothetical protein
MCGVIARTGRRGATWVTRAALRGDAPQAVANQAEAARASVAA